MNRVIRPLAIALCLAACASAPPPVKSIKPVSSDELVDKAKPKLAAFLQRVLPGKEVHGKKAEDVKLVEAKLFSEGHINETWKLVVEIDKRLVDLVLKVFPDQARGDANAAKYRTALAQEWPVPLEYVRDKALPYSERPCLLMEYITGGTLQTRIKRQFDKDGRIDVDAMVASYGSIGEELGRLHARNLRDRTDKDPSGKALMDGMIATCKKEGWCGPMAQERLGKLGAEMAKGKVTFVHGDLYESQVVLRADRKVASFIDLDQSGYADPATDVGSLLAHVVLINPWTRDIMWDVADPTKEETKAVAEELLRAYKENANLDDEWPAFLERVKGNMWLRLHHVLDKLRGNVHAADLMEELEVQKRGLATSDPFEDYGLNP